MKIKKCFISLGMVSVLLFVLHDFLGIILWKGYNPARDFISGLTADVSPYAGLLRIILYISLICLALFVLTLIEKSINERIHFLCFGAILLLLMVVVSVTLFGAFPASFNFLDPKNLFHVILTIIIIVVSLISLFVIAIGFTKQEAMRRKGILFLVLSTLYLLFNLLNLLAILNGMTNILGLLERLSIYTLQMFIFVLSYVLFRKRTIQNHNS
ncbi:MAG: DUF998 domain-containing protein [Eubacteriales bacterium]|nr:DUF998 domain-containing protein [Eubacteriales bacterium]MDD4475707.1 DUF998 domain-containing protein [Eubacteriales bacterium]